MAYRDILDWVGETYSVKRFAQEAETRGCCRKVASWAPWLEVGRSRVFLAHRGGFTQRDKGVIFGYYELAGADLVMSPWRWIEYRRICQSQGYSRHSDNGGDPDAMPEEVADFWRRELPAMGSPQTDGQAAASRARRQAAAEPREQELLELLVDGLLNCDPPPLPMAGARGISTLHTSLEEERWCGFRPFGLEEPLATASDVEVWWQARSGLYLVDALTQEVDRVLCELLEKASGKAIEGAEDRFEALRAFHRQQLVLADKRPRRQTPKPRGRRAGSAFFDRAAREAARKVPPARIPPELAGHAAARGALVLFNKPYPYYQQIPQAAFQNYLKIDGDELMEQIATYYRTGRRRKVEIPYYVERLEDGSLSWPGLTAMLARRTGMGKSMSRSFLTDLIELVGDELQERHPVGILHFGRFDVRQVPAREARLPNSGEKIRVPARQRIRFKAAKDLKELVNSPADKKQRGAHSES